MGATSAGREQGCFFQKGSRASARGFILQQGTALIGLGYVLGRLAEAGCAKKGGEHSFPPPAFLRVCACGQCGNILPWGVSSGGARGSARREGPRSLSRGRVSSGREGGGKGERLPLQSWARASSRAPVLRAAQRVGNSERVGLGGPGAAAGPWEWRRARVAFVVNSVRSASASGSGGEPIALWPARAAGAP